jgi:hypothetical protein
MCRVKIFLLMVSVAVLLVPCVSFASQDEPVVITLELAEPVETATPSVTPVPERKPTIALPDFATLPECDYDDAAARCLSRAIYSVTPRNPTYATRIALAEVVQNMVDDGRYKDTIRYTLLMDSEFPSYDPDAYRSEINNEVADIVMRSWMAAKDGDRQYRLTPETGVRFAFYNEKGADYIIVYDWDWNVVFDSVDVQHDTP